MHDVTDLRTTIIPKSDQLNSEQLIAGPMDITITDVRIGSSDEQPISVHYEGENGRPFKPCKTMRKVLIFAWGPDGRDWVGRSLTLYNDQQVKFGGAEVGGIRISHMSDIDRDIQVSLTATKGKKALHTIRRMEDSSHANAIRGALTVESLKEVFRVAYRSAKGQASKDAFKALYDKRMAVLAAQAPPAKTLQDFVAEIDGATSAETASLVIDEARRVLDEAGIAELQSVFDMAWKEPQ